MSSDLPIPSDRCLVCMNRPWQAYFSLIELIEPSQAPYSAYHNLWLLPATHLLLPGRIVILGSRM